jgi:hypothetical protein
VIVVTSCGGESNHQSTTTTILTTTRVSDTLIKTNPLNEAPPVRHKPEIIEADNNHDGVMDSVEVYINDLSDSTLQKAALRQYSMAITAALTINKTNHAAVHDAVKKIDLASQCIYSKYVNVVLAAKKTEAIESISLNTINRFVAYEQFKSALSSAPSLRSEGDGCLPMIRMSYLQKKHLS